MSGYPEYETLATKLARQQARDGTPWTKPENWGKSKKSAHSLKDGKRNKSEITEVPAEKPEKLPIPDSTLTPSQRYSLQIKTGYVIEKNGLQYVETEDGAISIPVATSDYTFTTGDIIDILPAFLSAGYTKYIILGRRKD